MRLPRIAGQRDAMTRLRLKSSNRCDRSGDAPLKTRARLLIPLEPVCASSSPLVARSGPWSTPLKTRSRLLIPREPVCASSSPLVARSGPWSTPLRSRLGLDHALHFIRRAGPPGIHAHGAQGRDGAPLKTRSRLLIPLEPICASSSPLVARSGPWSTPLRSRLRLGRSARPSRRPAPWDARAWRARPGRRAASAVASSTAATAPSVSGSRALTPNNRSFNIPATVTAATSPMTNPQITRIMPSAKKPAPERPRAARPKPCGYPIRGYAGRPNKR